MRRLSILVAMWSFVWASAPAVTFRDMVPAAGVPGTDVRLSAAEALAGSFSVRIGATGAVIPATVEGSDLLFVIPPGTSTGDVFVSADGGDFEKAGYTFRVARAVPVRLDVPNTGVFVSHDVGSTIEDAVLEQGTLMVLVPVGETALVAATAEDPDAPQLMAFITDSMTEAVLGAESTATAMVFLSPGIHSSDPVEADPRLAAIRALDGVVQAAQIANAHLAVGRDFLQDARYEDALVAALTEYSQIVAAGINEELEKWGRQGEKLSEDTVSANYDFADGSPRDLPGAINVLLTSAMAPTVDANNVPVRRMNLEGRPLGVLGKKINPLDWIAHAWALDPEQFSGLAEVNAMTAAQAEARVYTRQGTQPVSSLSVKATNVLKNFNVIDVVADALLGFAPSFPPKDGLEFPADRAGVYMVRSYSGAVYPALDPLISALPEGGDEDAAMKGINVVLAVVDFASIFLPIKTILGNELLAKIAYRSARDVTAAMIREGNEGRAMTAEFVTTVFLEVAKGITKQIFSTLADLGLKAIPRLGKSVAKFVNVLGKVASGGAAVERLAALTNASRFLSERAFFAPSVESSIVVIGDPFAPEVVEVSPRRAHRGRLVTLTGRRFLDGQPAAHIVRFGGVGTDPYQTGGAGRVILATRDTLVVEVPEEAETGPITVAVMDRGVANTARIADGMGLFTVIPDPVITAVSPSSIIPGGMVRVEGSGFAAVMEDNRVTFSGSSSQALSVLFGTDSELLVQAPSDLASGTVTVKVGNRTSNGFPLSTVLPAIIPAGGTLFVSTTADNTAADGQLTLREAMLYASGRLGRALTSPPPDPPPGSSYESNFVSGSPGAGVRDQIIVTFSDPTVLALGAPLPTFGNFDEVQFTNVTIDGAAAGGDGLVFDGIRSRIQNVTVTGFGGSGVRFTGDALGCEAVRVKVLSPGAHGALFDGNAQLNVLDAFSVEDAVGDGVRLEGSGVRFNRMTRPGVTGPGVDIGHILRSGGHGVVIMGGATANWLAFGDVMQSGQGGVLVASDSPGNMLGRADSSIGIFPKVFSNRGPGVTVEAARTAVRYLNVGSNAGDGILLQGASATDCIVDLVRVGYEYDTGAAAPNQGHGIHIRRGASHILVGRRGNSSFGARTSIAGNRDDGIRVDGTDGGASFVDVKHCHIGLAISGIISEVSRGNGGAGVALVNASDCEIGDLSTSLDVHINNHATEGILISGEASTRNRVFNCQIGSHHDGRDGIGNAVGIRVAGGAWRNIIGQRNGPFFAFDGTFVLDGKGANVIMNNSDAGIVLASGGDPTTTQNPTDPPSGGNTIIGNRIGGPADNKPIHRGNGVGLRLEDGARYNRIGGREQGDANHFAANIRAGIHINGGTVAGRSVNRIIGNIFERQGETAPPSGDPLTSRPNGVGVLVTGGAKGHLIGSSDPISGNKFIDNLIGVYTEDSEEITIAGNEFMGNVLAGAILLNSQRCVCGPNNTLHTNGNNTDPLAAIVLAGGGEHRVWGNEIGGRAPDDPVELGNLGHGVTILDSADNLIGGGNGAGNVIVRNQGNGILIRGVGSTGNQVATNRIGARTNFGPAPRPNTEDGIRLDQGANNNTIGGLLNINRAGAQLALPVGNKIIGNGMHGVQVDGAATIANTITWNAIGDHDEFSGFLGIHLSNGGNQSLAPPVITRFEAGVISGTSTAPNGSLVQVFCDPSDEGMILLGEALVAGGEWSILPGLVLHPNLTATVTHVTTGSTSGFGTRINIDDLRGPALIVRRSDRGAPQDAPVFGGRPSALHDFELESDESPIRITRVEFRLNPDLTQPQLADLPYLLHDTNGDGRPDAGDRIISGPPTDDATTGVWNFDDIDVVIDPGSVQRWLLVGTVSGTTGPFQLSIESATSLDSVVLFPAALITATGPFPVPADRLTLTEVVDPTQWTLY
jgi:parallel beta-helix repeat protein